MRRAPLLSLTAFAAMLLCCAPPAQATQHLVRAGDEWSDLAPRLKPGDEVILMPGTHRSATLNDLRGLQDRPIVIRALDPAHRPVIEADNYGIRIRRPKWVEISDIIIEGAKIHGLLLDAAPDDRIDALHVTDEGAAADSTAGQRDGEPGESGWVTLSNLTIRDTGPRGQRHAIHLRHIEEVHVDSCVIEGWGGSGIEVAGCRHVRIDACVFRGKDDHYQVSGVRMRAGSGRVVVTDCSFFNAGDQAVCLGGASEPEEFPTAAGEAAPGVEVQDVRVERCLIRGGQCAVAFVHCNGAVVRNCTVLRPQRAVVSVRNERSDGRCAAVAESVLRSNLIVWEPGDVQTLMHVLDADPTGLLLEENLWWSPDLAESLERIGPMPGTAAFQQVTEVDPKLDEDSRPSVEAAELFGIFAP